MADLIGYEKRDPAILRQMPTGYPRFVVHPFVRTLTQEFARRQGLHGQGVWLASTAILAEGLRRWMGAGARVVSEGDLVGVAFAADPERNARAKTFLQRSGGFISARHAEDRLAAAGLVPAPDAEDTVANDPGAAAREELRRAFHGTGDDDLFITANGMNAVYSAFGAVNAVQAPRGRTTWIQLGWLYLDTIGILQQFTADPSIDYVVIPSVHDLDSVRQVMRERPGRVAGIVTEVPTNPLVQSCDVPALAALAREHGAKLLLDGSIASPWNISLLPFADIALASLTKYAAAEGDLLAGVVAVNPDTGDAAALRHEIATRCAPLYRRDLARLAREIGEVDSVLAAINLATPRIVEFLSSRSDVKRVHWAKAPESAANFLRIARTPDSVGGVLTFEVAEGAFAGVYDRAPVAKGPTFGIRTTLLCPFMYLAHYDIVSAPAGRDLLASHGINPELLRLSIGLEPVDAIIAALAEALDAGKTS